MTSVGHRQRKRSEHKVAARLPRLARAMVLKESQLELNVRAVDHFHGQAKSPFKSCFGTCCSCNSWVSAAAVRCCRRRSAL